MKLTLKQAMERIAELETQVAALTPKKKGKATSAWKEPNTLDKVESLTDTREWRNVSWSGGTPPGPWERELLEHCATQGVRVKIKYSPYSGGTRGEREKAAKEALDSLTSNEPGTLAAYVNPNADD